LVVPLAAVVGVLQLPADEDTAALRMALAQAGDADRVVLTTDQDQAHRTFARRFLRAASTGNLLADSPNRFAHFGPKENDK
jgi:hypothetical protein